ncbi:MAG: YgeY family selenium metabolism-linked hydrolase [Caldilineales bacterium]
MNTTDLITPQEKADLISFAQDLVRIQSLSGQEEQAIRLVEQKMHDLGFDEVIVDAMGNVLGRIGDHGPSILFDSHVDTVAVNDEAAWDHPPFGGVIAGGLLYGRGSVDMKSSAAASLYAAAAAHRLGYTAGKTVYVSATVFEEDCDGENLRHMFRELDLRPDNVVICEPSNNRISLGHRGKAQIAIRTHGVSAHGSAPEKGVNAIYEMAEIIQRVEATNAQLMASGGQKGTLVMSRIASTAASLNAVPSECEAYLDRRIAPGETEDDIRGEMDRLVAGKRAEWQIGTLHRTSWTGLPITYEPFHMAWQIDPGHTLAQACAAAYRDTFAGQQPEFIFWDFSTNAVTPTSLGIPTIGFGPGDQKLAHMPNEACPVQQIVDACRFYTQVIRRLPAGG